MNERADVEPTKETTFGLFLRALRKQAHLTLQAVSDAAREIAPEAKGRISQPYLAQLERGGQFRLSYQKLASLASIYVVSDDLMIDQAPEPLRAKLYDERKQLHSEGWTPPPPVGRPPSVMNKIDRELHTLVAGKAVGVRIPMECEREARDLMQGALRCSCMPLFLESIGNVADEFCRRHRSVLGIFGKAGPAIAWLSIGQAYNDFVVYDLKLGPELLNPLASWSFEFETELVSVHFTNARDEKRYGFADIPFHVVTNARLAQTMGRLASQIVKAVPGLIVPEAPRAAGVRAFLEDLIAREGRLPIRRWTPIGHVLASAAAVAKTFPEFKGQKSLPPQVKRALDFLNRLPARRTTK